MCFIIKLKNCESSNVLNNRNTLYYLMDSWNIVKILYLVIVQPPKRPISGFCQHRHSTLIKMKTYGKEAWQVDSKHKWLKSYQKTISHTEDSEEIPKYASNFPWRNFSLCFLIRPLVMFNVHLNNWTVSLDINVILTIYVHGVQVLFANL